MTRTQLAPLTPLQQLAAGRRARRLVQLVVGLVLYGVSMAMMVRAGLGLDPWDVFHFGIAQHLPVSFGTVVIVVGALALLAWVPLRQWPGLGTIANVVEIGLATDQALALLQRPDALAARVALLLGGIVLNGLAGALYIGSQFGPGPRDGLMTGLVRRTDGGRRVGRARRKRQLHVPSDVLRHDESRTLANRRPTGGLLFRETAEHRGGAVLARRFAAVRTGLALLHG